jgi:hypothetical protein
MLVFFKFAMQGKALQIEILEIQARSATGGCAETQVAGPGANELPLSCCIIVQECRRRGMAWDKCLAGKKPAYSRTNQWLSAFHRTLDGSGSCGVNCRKFRLPKSDFKNCNMKLVAAMGNETMLYYIKRPSWTGIQSSPYG